LGASASGKRGEVKNPDKKKKKPHANYLMSGDKRVDVRYRVGKQ